MYKPRRRSSSVVNLPVRPLPPIIRILILWFISSVVICEREYSLLPVLLLYTQGKSMIPRDLREAIGSGPGRAGSEAAQNLQTS